MLFKEMAGYQPRYKIALSYPISPGLQMLRKTRRKNSLKG
jgi:hypothetical protein